MSNQPVITVSYPDQPYHTTTNDNLTFEMTYIGPRYILCQVDRDDHQVREAARSEKRDDPALDASGYEQDDYHYVLLDAHADDASALYAAYITDEYTHPDVDDYEEECTDADGNTWTFNHVYEGTTGMLPHIYYAESLLYYADTGTWRAPQFRQHNISRESVLDSLEIQERALRRALADSDQSFTDAERTELTEYADWLADVERLYDGINHWKWPFPDGELPDWEDPDPEDPND